ncbi:hypothetical protein SAMD00079811_31300 [Scytonema sp. HK-05]|nr:hypothetical protein SAMD00079811_31300 [Scytonema sp. HK-05]
MVGDALTALRVCLVGTATAIACTVRPPEEARHVYVLSPESLRTRCALAEPALCAYGHGLRPNGHAPRTTNATCSTWGNPKTAVAHHQRIKVQLVGDARPLVFN